MLLKNRKQAHVFSSSPSAHPKSFFLLITFYEAVRHLTLLVGRFEIVWTPNVNWGTIFPPLGPKNCVFFRDPKIAFFQDGQPPRPIETQGCRFEAYLILKQKYFWTNNQKEFLVVGWNQFWQLNQRPPYRRQKLPPNRQNVSFMALRSCNVVCYKTVCAKLNYITLKNEPIRRPDFYGRPSYQLHVNLMKVWLKLFGSEQMFH